MVLDVLQRLQDRHALDIWDVVGLHNRRRIPLGLIAQHLDGDALLRGRFSGHHGVAPWVCFLWSPS